MSRFSIREKCRVNTNRDADVFVGVRCEDGDIRINFPLGYKISENERELRKDILLLLQTIKTTTARKDAVLPDGGRAYRESAFPMQAYLTVIYDYYARGYYRERQTIHSVAKSGRIDWNKTIGSQKAYIQGANAYYLDFVTKKSTMSSDALITRIHEYCVYESFSKIGWLFTGALPLRSTLQYHEKLFQSVLRDRLVHTFRDRDRALLLAMLAIVNNQEADSPGENYEYGTHRFEYVWEAMIDKVYGIRGKADYFPRAYWDTAQGVRAKAPLEPDTIMVSGSTVYVLDAKYYKYGVTGKESDLPGSASVNKQITYAEYIAEQEKFRQMYGDDFQVYNAFLMPFCAELEHIVRMGEACGDWKSNKKPYERVQGILVDTKYLMKANAGCGGEKILELADKIGRFV